ncbi:hypothetical protein BDQ17DRAFT_1338744 [Cyathus striatus]|nr:hypothetical protein BDQ17DRAFT_1338744 [Cyathus striatus]
MSLLLPLSLLLVFSSLLFFFICLLLLLPCFNPIPLHLLLHPLQPLHHLFFCLSLLRSFVISMKFNGGLVQVGLIAAGMVALRKKTSCVTFPAGIEDSCPSPSQTTTSGK